VTGDPQPLDGGMDMRGEASGHGRVYQVGQGSITIHESGDAAPSPVDRQADRLAAAMRAQAQRVAVERGLIKGALLPVRWRRSTLPVAGPVSAATQHDGGIRFPALPRLAPVTPAHLRQGDRVALHAIYGGLASGRLLILGPGGAGKSSAALLLQLDALHHRERLSAQERRLVPVPIIVTPHGWNPKTTSVRAWLVEKLVESNPFRGRNGRRDAGALVDAGGVAVFLDGLDEVNESLRAMMLRALSEQVTFRLVLLTRSAELVAAVEGALLVGAVALQLRPLTPADAVAYLKRHLVDPPPPPWRAVTGEITRRPTGPLGQALTNPLNVTLLLDVYRTGRSVDELLDEERFGTAQDIELHLLDGLVGAAYAPQLGFPLPRYSVRTAQRTLGFLGYQLMRFQSREFGWWDFYRWVSLKPSTLLLNSVFAVVLVGLGVAAVAVPMMDLKAGLTFAGALALSFATPGGSLYHTPLRFAAAWRRDPFTGRPVAPGLPGQIKGSLVGGAALGALVGGLVWLSVGPVAAAVAGALTAVAVVVLWSLGALLTAPNTGESSWSDPRRSLWHDVRAAMIMGSVMGFVGGAAVTPFFGLRTGSLAAVICLLFGGLLATEMWAAFLSQLNLALRHRTPVRMVRFLEDARRRHLLRAVGPTYQFRHLKVQDHLVGQYLIEHHVASVASPEAGGRRREVADTARFVLHIGAMLDSGGVPAEVFGLALRQRSLDMGLPTDDVEVTKTAVGSLLRTGLIALATDEPSLSGVNSGVQRAIRGRLSDAERATLARAAADALIVTWPRHESSAETAAPWRANAIALSRNAGDALWRPATHDVLLRVGVSLRMSGEATAAAEYFRSLLATAHRVAGAGSPQALAIQRHLDQPEGES